MTDLTPAREARLPDGTPVVVRPLRPEDEPLIRDGFDHLSAETRRRRFLGGIKRLPPAHEHAITNADGWDHLVWGIAVYEPDPATGEFHEHGIGIAHVIREKEQPTHGEYAIVIADEWQKRGAGKVLTRALAERSLAVGMPFWLAVMYLDNRPVQHVLADVAEEVSRCVVDAGVGEVLYRLREPPRALS